MFPKATPMLILVTATFLAGCVETPASEARPPPTLETADVATASDPASSLPPGSETASDPPYRISRSCIGVTVASPGHDAAEVIVVGTLMVPVRPSSTIVVLVPGGDSTREGYDVAATPAEFDAGITYQRYLSARGVATLAIDRPGMGESQYSGPALTVAEVESVFAQLIQAVRTGSWASEEGCTPGPSFEKVVMGGLSLGGMMTGHYAANHDDLDGILLAGPWFNGFSSEFQAHLTTCLSTDDATGTRTNIFCEAGSSVAPCSGFMGEREQVDEALLAKFCQVLVAGQDSISTEGIRYPSTGQALIPLFPAVPVHVVFFEKDHLSANPGFEANDRDQTRRAFEHCPCAMTSTVVPGTGHLNFIHAGQEVGYQSIVDWLRASGLTVN